MLSSLNVSPAPPFGGRQSHIVVPRHCPTSSCWRSIQAPLPFLNAYHFRHDVLAALRNVPEPVRLVILEASAILEIDFTAAQVLRDLIRHCQKEHIVFAMVRLESISAQEAVNRFGIDAQLGPDRLFLSVDEAVRAIGGQTPTVPPDSAEQDVAAPTPDAS